MVQRRNQPNNAPHALDRRLRAATIKRELHYQNTHSPLLISDILPLPERRFHRQILHEFS